LKLKNDDKPEIDLKSPAVSTGGGSRLGRGITVNGDITGREDLTVEGHCQGKISLKDNTLTVEQGARIQAEIQAKNIAIRGSVQGNISASGKVLIQKEAQLDGDITAARISIEDGAQFKGSVKMNTPDSPPSPKAPSK
jgi:cytoskeletal protein CcmA (bactofilin family)